MALYFCFSGTSPFFTLESFPTVPKTSFAWCKPLINGSQGFDSVEIIRTAIRTPLTANMWNDQFFTPNWRFSFTQLPQGARLHPGPLFPPFGLVVTLFLSYFTKLRVHRDSSLNMENPKDNNHLEHLAVALQDYKIHWNISPSFNKSKIYPRGNIRLPGSSWISFKERPRDIKTAAYHCPKHQVENNQQKCPQMADAGGASMSFPQIQPIQNDDRYQKCDMLWDAEHRKKTV